MFCALPLNFIYSVFLDFLFFYGQPLRCFALCAFCLSGNRGSKYSQVSLYEDTAVVLAGDTIVESVVASMQKYEFEFMAIALCAGTNCLFLLLIFPSKLLSGLAYMLKKFKTASVLRK